MLTDQRKRPLLQTKLGAFLYAHFRSFGVAAKGGEDGHLRIDAKGIIAPMASRDHPTIKVEDLHQLPAVERGDWAPIPFTRERRDDTQADFTFGRGSRAAFIVFSSLRSAAISSSS